MKSLPQLLPHSPGIERRVWTAATAPQRTGCHRPTVTFAARPTLADRGTRDFAAQSAVAEAYAGEEYGVGEVEWNAQLANAVSLVGRLGQPLEVRPAGRGQVANCSLAVSTGRDRPASFFDIELWDGLAVAAAGELRKGEFVQVLGKLKMNEWLNKQGVKQRSVRVNVSQIHRVRPPSQVNQEWEPAAPSQLQVEDASFDDQTAGLPGWGDETPTSSQPQVKGGRHDQEWDYLLKNMDEFYDNRMSKPTPRHPDFKHKETRRALWLDSAPTWAREELSSKTEAPL